MSDRFNEICDRHEGDAQTVKHLFLDVGQGEQAHRDREWLLDRVSQLRAALRFYADESRYKPTSWHMCGHSTGQAILIDGGSRARTALEAKS